MIILLGFVLLAAACGLLWRWASRRIHLPCPAEFEFMLENPYFNHFASAARLIQLGEIEPGMSVLDVGCGPGRVTLPLAHAVGATGNVTALDVQEKMLDRVRERALQQGRDNIACIHGGAGSGLLPEARFDRAVLVTVLGEIPDRHAALREILRALKPGGVLLVGEVLPDPHFQTRKSVRSACEAAGFEFVDCTSNLLAHTTRLRRSGLPASYLQRNGSPYVTRIITFPKPSD
jgi:ubiquinone/menaquinone biosynthesis C-methylase UbiE